MAHKQVQVSFDLSNPIEALTYQQLAASTRLAGRKSRGRQAGWLLSLILSARRIRDPKWDGLSSVPDFPAQERQHTALLKRATARAIEKLICGKGR